MSIVNAFIHPDCGFVCVDTAAATDAEEVFEVSKLVPLPHMNAVVAIRGSVLFLAGVVTGASVFGGNFDGLSEGMPEVARLASEKALEHADRLSHMGLTAESAGCGSVLLVGFSPKYQRIVGHHFMKKSLGDDFATVNGIVQYAAPFWDDLDIDLSEIRANPEPNELKALAVRQVRLWREREKPISACGGRLILAKIQREKMSIESIMNLPIGDNLQENSVVGSKTPRDTFHP